MIFAVSKGRRATGTLSLDSEQKIKPGKLSFEKNVCVRVERWSLVQNQLKTSSINKRTLYHKATETVLLWVFMYCCLYAAKICPSGH